MNIAGGIRCAPDDIAGLKCEIERRDRMIMPLIEQAERGCDPTGGLTQLHALASLEHLVRRRSAELKRSVSEMEMFIRHAPAGIVFTRNHVILRYNHQFERMFGLRGNEGIGQSTRILFRSDAEFETARTAVDPILSASKTHNVDAFMRHRNGTDIWVHSIGYAVASENPGISAVWMMEDRTSVKIAEEALHRSNAELQASSRELERRELELRTILDNAHDVYMSIDSKGIVTSWNHQAEILYGWTAAEIIGVPLHERCIPPDILPGYFENLRSGTWARQRLELPSLKRNGTRFMIEVRVNRVEFAGEITYHIFLHDITERRASEAKREFEARHDALTGLPNRRGLMESIPLAIERANRSAREIAILFLDLDGFKAINDEHGHEAGDCLLQEVARRLRQEIRLTDTVARLAGDEFIVVLENLEHPEVDAPHYAQRLIEKISAPMQIGGEELSVGVSVSVGILCRPQGSSLKIQDLVKQADAAMYQAKKAGKGRYVIFTAPESPAS